MLASNAAVWRFCASVAEFILRNVYDQQSGFNPRVYIISIDREGEKVPTYVLDNLVVRSRNSRKARWSCRSDVEAR